MITGMAYRGETFNPEMLRGDGGLRTELVGAWYSGRDPWHRRVSIRKKIVDTRYSVEWNGGSITDRCAYDSRADAEAWAERLRTPSDGEGYRAEWVTDGQTDRPWYPAPIRPHMQGPASESIEPSE